MIDYKPKGPSMEKWRRFANATMERFPPGFLLALFLLAIYRALDIGDQIPAIDWIAERFSITAEFWKTVFIVCAGALVYFRPTPKLTLILSLPAAFLGGAILWYGLATGRDVVAMIFIFAAWFALGLAQMLMVLYHEQVVANELLAEKIDKLTKERDAYAVVNESNPAPPASA